MSDSAHLLLGTILLRPYVFIFLLVFLAGAIAHIGPARTWLFLPLGYAIAWLSEFSSIHWGFPYGDYYYIPRTTDRELWIHGVPFMDSLSYVFLSYCSYATAVFLLSPLAMVRGRLLILETKRLRRSLEVWLLGAFLFVLLDIIIDPVALQGDRWFLGQIYAYRVSGIYFGVPLSNFAGWLFVGFVLVGMLQVLSRFHVLEPSQCSVLRRLPGVGVLGPLLYLSVLVFNLTVTFSIGETFMGVVGCFIVFYPLLLSCLVTRSKLRNPSSAALERHLEDFPTARCLLAGDPEGTGQDS
ncbi:MAG: carotenoid biosynthesis protein [Deltaproteobacteria bacterium]|nr:carotenoid biosynthesis protein [Deltaproteobacteria bacterium]